jgi:hypothetical protein
MCQALRDDNAALWVREREALEYNVQKLLVWPSKYKLLAASSTRIVPPLL